MLQKDVPACACLAAQKKGSVVIITSEDGGQPG